MEGFRVDSFKYLPRSLRFRFEGFPDQPGPRTFVRPTKPLSRAKVALLTSAGLYVKDRQPPFDLERERQDPFWGDPSLRVLPRGLRQEEVGVAHLHINPDPILQDFNIVLPLDRLEELAREGVIGSVAERHYSVMGYQGPFPPRAWEEGTGPEIARMCREEGVDLVVLAPA